MLDGSYEGEKLRYQRKKTNETDKERDLRLANNRKVANDRKQKSQLDIKCNEIVYQHKLQNESLKDRETVDLQTIGSS